MIPNLKNIEDFKEKNNNFEKPMPISDDTEILKESVKIGEKVIPNRLVCQAMEGCDGTFDGRPDSLTKRRYTRFAKGGAGLIWYEATAVLPEGRANPRQLHINDANLDDFKRHVEEIKETALKENGVEPIIVMQATHSGRYSKPNGYPEPLIAYNNPIFEKDNPISKERILSDDDLKRVSAALINGAVLAEKAGFDGVDIKCCHRYLNSELLSAYLREGNYGGSFENRTRLLLESVKGAVENTSKDFIVTTRLNVYDGFAYPYGFGVKNDGSLDFEPTEPIELIKQLYALGVRMVNVSMGNPYFNPHVNRPFSMGGYESPEHPLEGVKRILEGTALIKKNVPEMKIVCSGITYLGEAAPFVVSGYIKDGGFDLAGFGRTIFANPDFANDIMKNGCLDKNKLCITCSKCTELMRAGSTPGCVIRDREIYLPLYKEFCGGKK